MPEFQQNEQFISMLLEAQKDLISVLSTLNDAEDLEDVDEVITDLRTIAESLDRGSAEIAYAQHIGVYVVEEKETA